MSKKQYCYKSECKATETCFRLEIWKVCSFCKEELSDTLHQKIKDKEKKKDDTPDETYYLNYGYNDPMGD